MVVTCPVCGKEFSDVTNFDINRHLDACLGSSLSRVRADIPFCLYIGRESVQQYSSVRHQLSL